MGGWKPKLNEGTTLHSSKTAGIKAKLGKLEQKGILEVALPLLRSFCNDNWVLQTNNWS